MPEPWVQGTGLLSLLLLLIVVLVQTLRSGPITHHRIQGAVAAYVLLGVIWAYAYSLVALLRPGALSGPVNTTDGPRAFFYFSFVTLTTVGYGDVLPVHPAARSLAVLEAVAGPLYLAILISASSRSRWRLAGERPRMARTHVKPSFRQRSLPFVVQSKPQMLGTND